MTTVNPETVLQAEILPSLPAVAVKILALDPDLAAADLARVIAQDAPGTLSNRLKARPDHLKRLKTLREEGRLVLAGPLPAVDNEDPGPAGYTGSLVVAEFPSIESAQAWADADPYVAAGVYAEVAVKPFRKVLP